MAKGKPKNTRRRTKRRPPKSCRGKSPAASKGRKLSKSEVSPISKHLTVDGEELRVALISPKRALCAWLIQTGKLQELSRLKSAHAEKLKVRPWEKGPMAIQRFSIPIEIADAFRAAGLTNATRYVMWQGHDLSVECMNTVLLTSEEMHRLMAKHCR